MPHPPTKPEQIRQGITISGLFIPEAMVVFHVIPFGASLTQLAGLFPIGFNALFDGGPCQFRAPEASCRFRASSRIAAMSPPNFSAIC